VVLDIETPADDGLDVLTRIGELAPEVVSVVLTNSASEHHRRECLGRGASFFFDKSRDFYSAVSVAVERARARAQAGP
jgi:DNA-binding NarL/FixJ family response regulator